MMSIGKKVKGSGVLEFIFIGLLVLLVFGGAFALYFTKGKRITTRDIALVEKIIGLDFTPKDRPCLKK